MYGKVLVLGFSIGISCLLVFALRLSGAKVKYGCDILCTDAQSVFFCH